VRLPPATDQISGCFHSVANAEAFADIRSYLQTADHHGQNLLAALQQLFNTGPWLPPPQTAST